MICFLYRERTKPKVGEKVEEKKMYIESGGPPKTPTFRQKVIENYPLLIVDVYGLFFFAAQNMGKC